jgi:hypothetical protein
MAEKGEQTHETWSQAETDHNMQYIQEPKQDETLLVILHKHSSRTQNKTYHARQMNTQRITHTRNKNPAHSHSRKPYSTITRTLIINKYVNIANNTHQEN